MLRSAGNLEDRFISELTGRIAHSDNGDISTFFINVKGDGVIKALSSKKKAQSKRHEADHRRYTPPPLPRLLCQFPAS